MMYKRGVKQLEVELTNPGHDNRQAERGDIVIGQFTSQSHDHPHHDRLSLWANSRATGKQ